MLYATPCSPFSRSYRVRDGDGADVAELEVRLLREGALLRYDGHVYRIERESLFGGPWRLFDGESVVYEAAKPSLLRNRFELQVQGAWLELSPTSWTLRRFVLVGPDWVDLGQVRRPRWLSRRVQIDLSDRVPRLAQLFVFFLAVVLWHRADASS